MKWGVSVWIPNRNHADVLGAAIYSAVREMPVEVLVIDDASTDASIQLIYAAERAYPSVSYVQHMRKSDCWEHAACPHIVQLQGQHIMSLSADDELCPGACLAPMQHRQAAVVFHAYAVRQPGKQPHGVVPTFLPDEATLTAAQVCERHLSDTLPMETGIGSAIRHDWQRWLIDHAFYRMGPWSDCIGFATVAALGGAVYVPRIAAVFTENPASYGAQQRSGDRVAEYHAEVRAFLDRSGLRRDVAAAICRKRGVEYA